MTYSVKIHRIGQAGAPAGVPRVYEAIDESDAITIAAYEVDGSSDWPHVATVTDATGRMLFTYSGRCVVAPT